MLGFSVRPARPEDLEAVAQLAMATEHAAHWDAASFASYLHADGPVQKLLVVAVAADEVIGFAVGTWLEGESMGELLNLAVTEKARRRGAGRALCVAVVEWLAEAGVAELQLEVRASNQPARALYEGMSFREFGRRAKYYQHPTEDAVLMRWKGEMFAGC